MTERCPMCHQALPDTCPDLTPRELELVTAWWMTGTVKAAAQAIGVGEQRAKNMMARARIRSRVSTNDQLLAAHMRAVLSHARESVQHNLIREAA